MEDTKKDTGQSSPDSQERRTVLKKAAVGVGVLAGISALPEKWTRPIVGQIVLPAHAQTSVVSLNDPCTINVVFLEVGIAVNVSGFTIPPTSGLAVQIVATPTPGAAQSANVTTAADGTYNRTFNFPGSTTAVNVVATLVATGDSTTCSWSRLGPTTTPGFTTLPPTTIPPSTPRPTNPPPTTPAPA